MASRLGLVLLARNPGGWISPFQALSVHPRPTPHTWHASITPPLAWSTILQPMRVRAPGLQERVRFLVPEPMVIRKASY